MILMNAIVAQLRPEQVLLIGVTLVAIGDDDDWVEDVGKNVGRTTGCRDVVVVAIGTDAKSKTELITQYKYNNKQYFLFLWLLYHCISCKHTSYDLFIYYSSSPWYFITLL